MPEVQWHWTYVINSNDEHKNNCIAILDSTTLFITSLITFNFLFRMSHAYKSIKQVEGDYVSSSNGI